MPVLTPGARAPAPLQVGYKSILHIHTAVEECEITKLIAEIDMKTKEQKKAKFVKQGGLCLCRISVEKPICIEAFQVGGAVL
jgi:peptide chain release factor subunit 3